MIFLGTPAPTGKFSKRGLFGFALAFSFWGHFYVFEPVTYADKNRKLNACSGLESPFVRRNKPSQEVMLSKPSVSCCFFNRLVLRAEKF